MFQTKETKVERKRLANIEKNEEEESDEEVAWEYELADGTTVYVDSEWNAYNEEAEELGVVDPKTKTLTAKE